MADAEGLNPQFAAAINAMIAASHGRITIESGFRSVQDQQALWDRAVAKYGSPEAARQWVAPPGHSNHNRGLAVDLGGDTALAHQLAPQFGLVFPMSWEPWHIEPVGARETAHPDAYTTPPPGEQNPTTDTSLPAQPDFMAATLASAMHAALDPTFNTPAADPTATAVDTNATTDPTVAANQTGTSAGVPGTNAAATVAATPGAPTDPAQRQSAEAVYKALRAQGMDPAHAAIFTAIAGRESGFNPTAYNGNRSTGDDSYGLFQINLLHGGWAPFLKENGMANPAAELRTLDGSARAAKIIFDHSGLTPWGGYKGRAWNEGTNPQAGVDASGGEVTMQQVQPYIGRH